MAIDRLVVVGTGTAIEDAGDAVGALIAVLIADRVKPTVAEWIGDRLCCLVTEGAGHRVEGHVTTR